MPDQIKIQPLGTVVDESEFCYKKPNVIREAISDNAEILSVYTPILNLKDVGESISWKERKERDKAEKTRDNKKT